MTSKEICVLRFLKLIKCTLKIDTYYLKVVTGEKIVKYSLNANSGYNQMPLLPLVSVSGVPLSV